LLVRTLAASLDVEMRRVQFTPDLMPGDVTGSLVYDNGTSDLTFREGPVFTNLLLADEINRTPPKTQSALLEAMEERQVTIDGRSRALPDPFMVIATQNPIEFDGTYQLPEAQLDRFLLKAILPLPERDDEVDVLRRHANGFDARDLTTAQVRVVADPASLRRAQAEVEQVRTEDAVLQYIVDVCRATRRSPSLQLGASPRGAIALLRTAQAWAYLSGRDFTTPDDVKTMAGATLSHRVRLTTEAELEGSQVSAVLAATMAGVPVPR
jgi:MoxR-like ATPase